VHVGGRVDPRQVDLDCRGLPRLAVRKDEALALLADPLNAGGAQAGAIPRIVGAKKDSRMPVATARFTPGPVSLRAGQMSRSAAAPAWTLGEAPSFSLLEGAMARRWPFGAVLLALTARFGRIRSICLGPALIRPRASPGRALRSTSSPRSRFNMLLRPL
jgi:hypothetical protein